jgi:hypothetical protein
MSEQNTPATPSEGPSIGERAKSALARLSRVRPAVKQEAKATPAPAPAPAPNAKPGAKVANPIERRRNVELKQPGGPTLAAEDLELLRQYREDREKSAIASRVEYARRAGLRSGIDSQTAAALVGQFDVSTTEGRNGFEAFRKANPSLFDGRKDAGARRAESEAKYAPKEGKKESKVFNSKFANRVLARNFGRGGAE